MFGRYGPQGHMTPVHLIPELMLVLLCVCTEPERERCRRIKRAANTFLDWELILKIAVDQRVYPIVYKNLREILPDRVPVSVMNKLKQLCFDLATKNLYLFSYLLLITELLGKNDIVALPFKGLLLSHDLYGDLGMRPFSDLDVLVGKKDVIQAWQILLENGFEPGLTLDAGQRRKYIQSTKHIVFSKENISLELHWSMTGYLHTPLTMDHVRKSVKNMVIQNREILNLSHEELLVYLCVHGTSHGWSNLELVCCVARILKIKKKLDWERVTLLALKWQCTRMLYLGLYLAGELLDAPLPAAVMDKIKADKQIPALASAVFDCMFKENSKQNVKNISDKFSSFHIRTRDSFTDKMRYVFRLTFHATVKEWIEFPVPAFLSFLHFILRPSRLIKEGLKEKLE